jgi:ComF family protein
MARGLVLTDGSSALRLGAAALRLAVDTILPPRCLSCGIVTASPAALCGTCWRDLTFLGDPVCARCGVPFEITVASRTVCGRCLAEPPRFSRARAALTYDDASRPLILRFKHGDDLQAAPLFVTWMLRAGEALLADADEIVPVPLHRWRLFSRRYNQAAELARGLAKRSGVPAMTDGLIRVRRTPSQGVLGREARRRNVQGAFRPNPERVEVLRGKRVLLIDDVMTSGATVSACATALKRAGVRTVDVLTVARVV